jgi:hypothetical protein
MHSQDGLFARATQALIAALRADGYHIETPTTGHVLVSRGDRTLDLDPATWDRIAAMGVQDGRDEIAERWARLREIDHAD